MKKLLLPLLSILLFTACQKKVTTTTTQEEITGATVNKQTKFFVCHYDGITATWKTIEVTQNALVGHLGHGDVQGECSSVQTVTICDQVWMVKNLDVTTYRNGDAIPEVTDQTAWASLTTGAWCYYGNNSANGTTYGKLYNWYAVNDPRRLAPTGWHVPTEAEWSTLATCLGGTEVAGGKMKSVGTIEAGTGLWYDPNTDATNSSGFTGLPAGGAFNNNLGFAALWWSADVSSIGPYMSALLYHNSINLRDGMDPHFGLSVRCLRD